jgi:hypothetical protein
MNAERNSPVAIKWDINLGTIISLGLPLVGGLLWVNTQIVNLALRVQQTENYQVTQTTQTDKNFLDLTAAVRSFEGVTLRQNGDVANLTYRMGQSEANIRNMGERMDRVVDSVLLSVDSIKKDVGALSTKVEVMNQKIDSLDVPRTNRTMVQP